MVTKDAMKNWLEAAGKYGVPLLISVWLLASLTGVGCYLLPEVKEYLRSQTLLNVETKNALSVVCKQQDALKLEYAEHEAEHVKATEAVAGILREVQKDTAANGDKIEQGNGVQSKMLEAIQSMLEEMRGQRKNQSGSQTGSK